MWTPYQVQTEKHEILEINITNTMVCVKFDYPTIQPQPKDSCVEI